MCPSCSSRPAATSAAAVLARNEAGVHGPDLHLRMWNVDYHLDWQEPLANSFTFAIDDWGGVSQTTAMLQLERAELERAVRDAVSSYFHLSGTCRMGADAGAVVDPQLRVASVDGLREDA